MAIGDPVRGKIRTVELDYLCRSLRLTRENKSRNTEIWQLINIMSSIRRNIEMLLKYWLRLNETRWSKRILEWQSPVKREWGVPTLLKHIYNNKSIENRDLHYDAWGNKELWKACRNPKQSQKRRSGKDPPTLDELMTYLEGKIIYSLHGQNLYCLHYFQVFRS